MAGQESPSVVNGTLLLAVVFCGTKIWIATNDFHGITMQCGPPSPQHLEFPAVQANNALAGERVRNQNVIP